MAVPLRRWRQIARSSLHDLRAHRGRSTLTGFSLLIGVMAVVGIYTAGTLAGDVLIAQEEQRSGRAPTVETSLQLTRFDRRSAVVLEQATQARAAAQNVSAVVGVTTDARLRTLDQRRDNAPPTEVRIDWLSGDLRNLRRLPLRSGAWPNRFDALPPEIIVNVVLADQMGLVVDDQLVVTTSSSQQPISARVVGVVYDGGEGSHAYGALNTLVELTPSAVQNQSMFIRAHGPTAGQAGLEELVGAVAESAPGVPSGEPQRLDRVPEIRADLRNIQRVFVLAAAVALFVSAVGILNIGLASVGQRSRELVIRRAVGATRTDLFGLVVGSSLYIGLISAAIAVGSSAAFATIAVPRLLPPGSPVEAPAFPLSAAVAGVAAAVITCVIGAAVPAIRASRLPIADSLRD